MFSRIKLHNIGPFRDFEVRCGQVMILAAQNGGGKTTFVEAIKGLLDDHNADLITVGEDEGVAEFEFVDGLKVTQTITKRGSKYDIRKPDGQKVTKHKEYLRGLVSGIALDPLYLLRCSKDEVVEYLLKHIPINFSAEEISESVGFAQDHPMTLEEFDNLLAAKEADRSQQNKVVEGSKGHLTRIERSLPSYNDEGLDWEQERSRIQTERDKMAHDADSFLALKAQAGEADEKSINDQAKAEIEQARLEYERQRSEITRLAQESKAELAKARNAEVEAYMEGVRPKLDQLTTELAVAKERASRHIEVKTLRKSVEETRAQFREESQEATRRQRIVEAMRELRRRKLDKLPIPGIEIKNRQLYVDGKLFDGQTNTAEQIKVAFQLAALANRVYPVMVADGGDMLGAAAFRWVVDAAIASNFQVFITKRLESEKSLRVMSYEEYIKSNELAPA
jgi:hypothetical protein